MLNATTRTFYLCLLFISLIADICWAQIDQDTIPKPPTDSHSDNERYIPDSDLNKVPKENKSETTKNTQIKTLPTVRSIQLVLSTNSLISARGGSGSYSNLLKEAQGMNSVLNTQLIKDRNWQIKISKYQLPVSLFDNKLKDAALLLEPLAIDKKQLDVVNDTTFQPTQSKVPELLRQYVRYATVLEGQLLPTVHIQSNEIRQGIAEQHHTLSVALQTKFIELRLGRCIYLEFEQRTSPNVSLQYPELFRAKGVGDYLVWQDLKSNYEDVYYKLKSLMQTSKEYPEPPIANVEAARLRIRNWKSKFNAGIGSIADMQTAYKDLLTIEQAILHIAQKNFNNLGVEGWSEITLIKDRVIPLIDKAINDENWY